MRKKEAEKMEKSEGVVFFCWRVAVMQKLARTQTKRKLRAHFLDPAGADEGGPAPRLAAG